MTITERNKSLRRARRQAGLPPVPHSSWRLAVEPAPGVLVPVESAGEFWERLGL